jgi:AraC family transcriptional regulator of adaptative response / DNA-3-methyladenine glycosylase II
MMDGWYEAFKSKDARFDGRFFVGVKSTGIYCRPVCRAKLPKAVNCSYYPSAAAAEEAGFRPCLLCRPELAPSLSANDASDLLASRAACLIEEKCGSGQSLEELFAPLGYTSRHLRRVFADEFNIKPVQYLQTCRLLLAKSLLSDTKLTVLDVAMTAGFGSLRRFNSLFKKHYRLSPTELRRQTASQANCGDDITLSLGYRPPLRWPQIINFLGGRAIAGVESIRQGMYWRTVHLVSREQKHFYGWICVNNPPSKDVLTVTMSSSLLPMLSEVLSRVRNLFDLRCDPSLIYETLSEMNNIRPGLCLQGTRLPGSFDPFEIAVRAVLGQQITVKTAGKLAARVAQTYGTPIQTGIEGLTHTFPSPHNIINLDGKITDRLGALGIISSRSKAILALAGSFAEREIDFEMCPDPETEIRKLTNIPGIGSWTAKYIAMRAMRWPDVFLETDAGIKRALSPRTAREMQNMAESWRPWRSYATVNLWNSLHNTNQ